MGYMAHHAVVVHIAGYVWDRIPDLDEFRSQMPETFRPLCVGPIQTAINGDFVAAFLPDGSKEGWPESDTGDQWRQRFIDLFAFTYEDGSSPFDWVEVRFGGDEPERGWMKQRSTDGVRHHD